MKLTNKDKNFWKKNGYLVVKNVLNEKQCQEYKKEAHRVAGKNITIIPNIYRKSKKFLNLCKNKKILQLADDLIDHRMIPIGDIFFFAKSDTNKESGSVPHQDNYAQKAEYGAFVACAVAFDDALEENGALRVYPGSHKLGEVKCNPKPNFVMNKKGQIIKALPIGNNCVVPKKFKNKETIVEFKKGDIFFFHGHLIHYAKKNISKKLKFRRVIYLKLIKNGYAFWPGWSEKRTLIDRDDFKSKIIRN